MLNRCLVRVLIIIGFAAQQAAACPFRTHIPVPSDPARYSQIYLARVTAAEMVSGIFANSDLTPSYKLTVTEPATLVGQKFTDTTVKVGPGCGWPRPNVGARAMFFVEKDSGILVPIYEDPQHGQFDTIIDEIERSRAKAK